MADAELLADVFLAMQEGIVSTSPTKLNRLYTKYDADFPGRNQHREIIQSSFNFVLENFSNLRGTFMMKPYAVYTLITCLIFNRYGINAIQNQIDVEPHGAFCADTRQSAAALESLAEAHEGKDEVGPNAEYVWGASGGTNRAPRRAARFRAVLAALGNPAGGFLDAQLAR
jgi:hypothetical protein